MSTPSTMTMNQPMRRLEKVQRLQLYKEAEAIQKEEHRKYLEAQQKAIEEAKIREDAKAKEVQ